MARFQRQTLAERLASERDVWVRYAIDADDEIRVIEISIGHAPPTWKEVSWRYAQASFGARKRPGTTVGAWIMTEESPMLPHAKFATLTWPAMDDRRPSGAPGQSEILEWPVDEWRSPGSQLNTIPGELIPLDPNTPVFRSFDLGIANLLGLVQRAGWTAPSPQLVVRREDRTGRIAVVFIARGGSVDVTVEGDKLEGCILSLAGETQGPSRQLDSATQQDIRFEGPLPAGAWLALHREGELLDSRRQLDYPRPGGQPEFGVMWESAPAPTDNSQFTPEEQQEIRAAIVAVKLQLRLEIGDGAEADSLDEALDEAAAGTTRLGRIDFRRCAVQAVIEAGLRGAVTWDHVRLAIGLLRVGLRALTGLEVPALPS